MTGHLLATFDKWHFGGGKCRLISSGIYHSCNLKGVIYYFIASGQPKNPHSVHWPLLSKIEAFFSHLSSKELLFNDNLLMVQRLPRSKFLNQTAYVNMSRTQAAAPCLLVSFGQFATHRSSEFLLGSTDEFVPLELCQKLWSVWTWWTTWVTYFFCVVGGSVVKVLRVFGWKMLLFN